MSFEEEVEKDTQKFSGRMFEPHVRRFVEELQLEAHAMDAEFSKARFERIRKMARLRKEERRLFKEMGKR